jgi:hypothetical protein
MTLILLFCLLVASYSHRIALSLNDSPPNPRQHSIQAYWLQACQPDSLIWIVFNELISYLAIHSVSDFNEARMAV